jgi:hypothetical protein
MVLSALLVETTVEATRASCTTKATGIMTVTIGARNTGQPPHTHYLMAGANQFRITPQAIIIGPTFNNTVSFENVPTGVWTILTYDSSVGNLFDVNGLEGARYREWATVGALPAVEATIDYLSEDSGAGDGRVSAVITSGGGPYEFYLNGQLMPSGTFENLRKGEYSLRIFDLSSTAGCFSVYNFRVVQTLVANIKSVTPTCRASGRIEVNVTGGIEPYELRLLPLPDEDVREPQLGSTITGVPLGDRVVVVIDARGVQFALNATVPFASNGVNITNVITQPATTTATNDGRATVSIINGGVGTTFTISSFDGYLVRQQSNGSFVGLPSGLYSIEVADAFGCISRSTFEVGSLVTVAARATAPACRGLSPGNGRITANFAFGAMPYNVTLGTENVLLFTSSYTFENLVAGIYNISVIDANLIPKTFAVEVPAYELDFVNDWIATPPSGELLPGSGSFSLVVQYFEWKMGDAVTWRGSTSVSSTQLLPGNYTLQVRDTRGCSRNLDFIVPAFFSVNVDSTPISNTFCDASLFDVTVTVNGGEAPFRFMLTGESTSYPWQSSPVFHNVPVGRYVVNSEYNYFGRTYSAVGSIGLEPIARPARTLASVFFIPCFPC